ncbi:MAG: hypothetical protein JWM80_843 [Cyanobacteria bacterium RYN_339]|nr:hypothetical protein [Cyanobacteria bacterium RYN_339]
MFIADMQHFVDVWDPRITVPAPARRVAQQLGAIAEAATAMGLPMDRTRVTPIHCPKRPARVPCQGLIAILVNERRIEWICTTCRDAGFLSGFLGTPWDLTPTRTNASRWLPSASSASSNPWRAATYRGSGSPDIFVLSHPIEQCFRFRGPAPWGAQ